MRVIAKPTLTAKELFLECISTVEDQVLKQNLTACANIIEAAEVDFDNRFPLLQIHQIPRNAIVLGPIDKDQMKIVYKYRMTGKTMPGYIHYAALRSSAPYGKCPFCGVRKVDTLDHYLPKALYPVFAVTPINLVPACTPCNKGKLISYPTTADNQTLHPYYDDVETESCIKARLLPNSNDSFEYYVDCPAAWSLALKERVKNHFNAYDLNELYSSHANEELRGAKKQLRNLYSKHPSLLIEHLRECYESRLDLGINSWQAAMYRGLMDEADFINGGVLL